MNREANNIYNAAGDRRTYLSPRTEIIKMGTSNLIMESIEIPTGDPNATDANGKRWQGDDLDSWDEEDKNYDWNNSGVFGTYEW